MGNYDELLGRFQLLQDNRLDTNGCKNEHNKQEDSVTISDIRLPPLKGDVKIMFFSTNKVMNFEYDSLSLIIFFIRKYQEIMIIVPFIFGLIHHLLRIIRKLNNSIFL